MIVDNAIKDLVLAIENDGDNHSKLSSSNSQLRNNIIKLVNRLDENCKNNSCQINRPVSLSRYPINQDGFAQSFDPLTQEEAFTNAWQQYGVVVGKQIASPKQCRQTIDRIADLFNHFGLHMSDLKTGDNHFKIPKDPDGTSIVSRGFFEIYHDHALSQLRQNIRAYIHHVLIWRTPRIWTSFDRLGIKLPRHDSAASLPLHVDQNPMMNPDFKTLQGVLALVDCPEERGTFRGIAGSNHFFHHYTEMQKQGREYTELDITTDIGKMLEKNAQSFPLRAGDLISWDSRTTHANTANISDDIRFVFYMASGLAREDNMRAIGARQDVIKNGTATSTTKDPEALIRASLKPRYTNLPLLQELRQADDLSLLGELLYGSKRYQDIIKGNHNAFTP